MAIKRAAHAIAASTALLVMAAACSLGSTTPTAGTPANRPSFNPGSISPSVTASAAADEPLGAPGCHPASPIDQHDGLPEVEGTGDGVMLWGLIMGSMTAGQKVKIVWRMTGSGPIHLSAFDPDGTQQPLTWGPERHSGSNYDRPGQEWGTGYKFTQAGCWHLRARRGQAVANVWIEIDQS